MVIYMRHPVHGTKVAVEEMEARADEKNGWVRFQVGALLTPDAPAISVAPIPMQPPVDNDHVAEGATPFTDEEIRGSLAAQYLERFGKKPHHKKSVETLRRELEAA